MEASIRRLRAVRWAHPAWHSKIVAYVLSLETIRLCFRELVQMPAHCPIDKAPEHKGRHRDSDNDHESELRGGALAVH